MRLPKRLICALLACWMLASCARLTPPGPQPLRPLPAALLALCPPPPHSGGADMDALVLTLKRSYDAYGACAGQHAELVRWLDGGAGGVAP